MRDYNSSMAKYANGQTYREGNDNLNEHQFSPGHMAAPFSKGHAPKSHMKHPDSETQSFVHKGSGEKGGNLKKKGGVKKGRGRYGRR
jgi:hypothetical protein